MATFYSVSLLLVATASSFTDGIKNNNDNIETLLKIPTQCNQANVVKNTKSFGFPSVNQEQCSDDSMSSRLNVESIREIQDSRIESS